MAEPENVKEITYDLLGGNVSQYLLDALYGQVVTAFNDHAAVTITLKNVGLYGLPRLIADHGDILGLLVDELRANRQRDDGALSAKVNGTTYAHGTEPSSVEPAYVTEQIKEARAGIKEKQ